MSDPGGGRQRCGVDLCGGFLAVYPEGTGPAPTFNAGLCCGYAGRTMAEDVAFVRDVVAHVSATTWSTTGGST